MLPPLSGCACAHKMTWMYMYHSCVSFAFLVVMYILFLHIIFHDIESQMQMIKKIVKSVSVYACVCARGSVSCCISSCGLSPRSVPANSMCVSVRLSLLCPPSVSFPLPRNDEEPLCASTCCTIDGMYQRRTRI